MAAKSNPVASFLHEAKIGGLGIECASIGELSLALSSGLPSSMIVFDSPAKTRAELILALEKGVYINLDNLEELKRVEEILKARPEIASSSSLRVGLRLNPQIGAGRLEELSTATLTSKFGIPTLQYHDAILHAYRDHPWLSGVHVHVGSQGCPLDLIAQGINKGLHYVELINQAHPGRIQYFDMGGGLPVNFGDDSDTPSFKEYADFLRKHCPTLFTGKFKVITEFGRAYNAKPGIVVSRVEYTKDAGGRGIAVIHAGADLFVRTIYLPEKWPLRISVYDRDGKEKEMPSTAAGPEEWDIAGPCCFSGDIVAHKRKLPPICSGDYVMVHDTGAYYFSSFSHYNVRLTPPIYGYRENDRSQDGKTLIVMKKGESVDEAAAFFS
eukprot:TRINITY_DN5676_c0_g1_i4.p1 TRINITY_DN5676_c0_g1~~TRINITY_DN5676_c0_g1_i4.p1  ORF type:complete len:446 (-),score=72.94 TRINITY_DN5676_c0_g1_i4:8-1156(-)